MCLWQTVNCEGGKDICCCFVCKKLENWAIFFAFVWLRAVPRDTDGRFGRHGNRHLVSDPVVLSTGCRYLLGDWKLFQAGTRGLCFLQLKVSSPLIILNMQEICLCSTLVVFMCLTKKEVDNFYISVSIMLICKHLTLDSFHTCLKLP